MGAYLDVPKTEKETISGTVDIGEKGEQKGLPYVVSSMQGWRKSMEDAHISMTNLENQYDVPPGTSLFAVFDGHGGKGVSKFCARHFVDTLTELEAFKARAYREALVECFHKMDDLIRDPRYKDELDDLSEAPKFYKVETEPESNFGENSFDFDDESNESDPAANEVAQFGAGEANRLEETFGKLEDRKGSDDSLYADFAPADQQKMELKEAELVQLDNEKPLARRSESTNFGLINPALPSTLPREEEGVAAEEADNVVPLALKDEAPKLQERDIMISRSKSKHVDNEKDADDEVEDGEVEDFELNGKNPELEKEPKEGLATEEFNAIDNGDVPRVKSTEGATQPNGGVDVPPVLSSKMAAAESKGSLSKSEALDLILQVMRLSTKRGSNNNESLPARRNFDDNDHVLPTTAGTTACVCLIIEGKIFVANAGDSRAVLCRDMKAKALSFDHKPDQPIEKARIENAGGWVSNVGRVCNNLNLSRCIGDLKYKLNDDVNRAQQVITAEPDVMSLALTSDDMFLVIACDGVWDIMTNNMIVDFVGRQIVENKNTYDMKPVVEEVFNACICEDPMRAEGKGGDNMTCIIVCLRPIDDLVAAFSSD